MNTYYTQYCSAAGELLLVSNGTALTGLYIRGGDHFPEMKQDWIEDDDLEIFHQTAQQLTEYFAGKRTQFSIKLEAQGTEFQQTVWKHLLEIPYGKTVSYGQLAQAMGNPKAVRAVGRANGSNPISILVPCHRVIGADGSLTGYGGGMVCKEYLLRLETESKN